MRRKMTSREKILSAIEGINLPSKELPITPIFEGLSEDKHAFFFEMLNTLGVEVIVSDNDDQLKDIIKEKQQDGKVYSSIPDLGADDLTVNKDEMANLNLSVIEGQLGVAENGAIWVNGEDLKHRSLTAIASHLLIVLPYHKIVWNMHEAYTYIKPQDHGYGVFISGPSKTADIEQSLVKGAHGAKSLIVYIQK
ncbi:LutC/YkgG family protein [Flammeovirga pacifica]|nr:LUD domain-containing protein [Flammeovirga pacifica]